MTVIVKANTGGNIAEKAAAAGILFGASGWLALAIHAIGIEVYVSGNLPGLQIQHEPQLTKAKQLRLTPAENERLRKVSHQRRVEAGMITPEQG